jgi:hypothetical protein
MFSRRQFLTTTALGVTSLGTTSLASTQNLDDKTYLRNRTVWLVVESCQDMVFTGAIVGYDIIDKIIKATTMFNSVYKLIRYPFVTDISKIKSENSQNVYYLWAMHDLSLRPALVLMDMMSGDFQSVLEHALKTYPKQFVLIRRSWKERE